jgi:hypothetical protein
MRQDQEQNNGCAGQALGALEGLEASPMTVLQWCGFDFDSMQ